MTIESLKTVLGRRLNNLNREAFALSKITAYDTEEELEAIKKEFYEVVTALKVLEDY